MVYVIAISLIPVKGRQVCSKGQNETTIKYLRNLKYEIKANYRPEVEELSLLFFLPAALTTNCGKPLQQDFRPETVISKTRPSKTLKEILDLPKLEGIGLLWQNEFVWKRFFT